MKTLTLPVQQIEIPVERRNVDQLDCAIDGESIDTLSRRALFSRMLPATLGMIFAGAMSGPVSAAPRPIERSRSQSGSGNVSIDCGHFQIDLREVQAPSGLAIQAKLGAFEATVPAPLGLTDELIDEMEQLCDRGLNQEDVERFQTFLRSYGINVDFDPHSGTLGFILVLLLFIELVLCGAGGGCPG